MPNESATATRGVRGAIALPADTPAASDDTRAQIMDATEELLRAMIDANDIDSEDIAAVYFTVTPDLTAEFPAVAARERLGWHYVPLMHSVEVNVPGAMPKCIRVLMFLNTHKSQREIAHIYLGEAVALRPDIAPQ